MSHNTTERSLNMMEVICPEKGLTLFAGEIAGDPPPPVNPSNTSSVHNDHGSLLECLPPDLPSAGFNFSTSVEHNESELLLQSGKSEDDLLERVEKLAAVVKREVDTVRLGQSPEHKNHLDRKKPLHNQEERIDRVSKALTSQEKIQRTETKTIEPSASHDQEEEDEKISKALAKMRRLDNRLAELAKKERQVKQQRTGTDSDSGTNQSLSDVSLDFGNHVFQTQPFERIDKSVTDDDITDALRVECIESDSHSDMTGNETADKQKNSPNNDKSFIERNKELAGEKGEVLMTEKEKKRLEELMEESDEEKETREQVCTSVNGYSFTDEDLNRLNQIDSALECLVPTASLRSTSELSLNTPKRRMGQPGENVLVRIQSERNEQQRLKEIEDQLTQLEEAGLGEEQNKVCITEDELQLLLLQSQDEQHSQL